MRYRVLTLLCAAAVIAYVQRLGFNVAVGAIGADLKLNKEQLGQIMSAWFLGYALMQISAGWLADRFGSRRILTILAVVWSILTGMIGLAWDFYSLLAIWFAMGLAQAGIFPCAAKSIRLWFDDTKRASALGFLGSSMALGSAIAPALTGLLVTHYTWPPVFVVYALVGIAWAFIYFLKVVDTPPRFDIGPPAAPPRWTGKDWRSLFTSVPMILLCAQQFFRAWGMAFFFTWFATFLQETRGVDLAASGLMTGFVGLGSMAGGILGGFFSDWLLRRTGNRRLSRQGLAVIGLSLCSILVLISGRIEDRDLALGVIALGGFTATFGGIAGYTVAVDFGGKRVATVFSIMNTCGNIGAALFPFIVGAIIHSTGNWNLILYLFAGVLALDAIIWAFLNPRQPLFQDNDEPH